MVLMPQVFLISLLGTIGFCVLGTVMSALTLRARARELLLPLVLFPLMIPVILATIQCWELCFGLARSATRFHGCVFLSDLM